MTANESTIRLGSLLLALAADALLGEPPAGVHPVVWIGRLIWWLERRAPRTGRAAQLAYGAAIAVTTLAAAALPVVFLGRLSRSWHPLARLALQAVCLKPTFAARDLCLHLDRVRVPLEAGRLAEARASLQMIVSRDTRALDEGRVVAAAVESAAENASDSFVAPILFHVALGPAGAMAYRAANTLDAMIGYHGRHEYVGKAAARLDDAANLLPARLTAALIALAAPLGGGSAGRAWRVALAHHSRTESPNAGWPMSAMAGALGVELEKVGHYRLGEPGEPPRPEHLRRAIRVVVGAMGSATALAAAVLLGASQPQRSRGDLPE